MVSVIIPTYRRPTLLDTTIGSVLAQSYEDWELIVVDDNDEGSDDRRETEAFMARYGDQPRIRYLKHQRNGGPCAARNTGIRAARGDLVAFLDDDDAWLPKKLEAQVALFREAGDGLGLVYTGIKVVDGKGNLVRTAAPAFRGFDPLAFFTRGYITTPSSVMCKREALLTVGLFDESLLIGEDWDLYIKISQRYTFDYVAEPLTIYSKHGGEQLTRNVEGMARSYERLREKHSSVLRQNRKHHSLFLLYQGQMLKRAGGLRQAEEKFFQSIRVNPLNRTSLRSWLTLRLTPQHYDALRRAAHPFRLLARKQSYE